MLHEYEKNTLTNYTKILHTPNEHDTQLVAAAGIITNLLREIEQNRLITEKTPALNRSDDEHRQKFGAAIRHQLTQNSPV